MKKYILPIFVLGAVAFSSLPQSDFFHNVAYSLEAAASNSLVAPVATFTPTSTDSSGTGLLPETTAGQAWLDSISSNPPVASSREVLPSSVDNSLDPAFPPVGDQGKLQSCVGFATTYYQLTYEINKSRGLNSKNNDNSANYSTILSPKWTYNNINGGFDSGTTFSAAYRFLFSHGAVTWNEFPYDKDYLSVAVPKSVSDTALTREPLDLIEINDSGHTDNESQFISDIKAQLAGRHLVVIFTMPSAWVVSTVKNDPKATTNSTFVGQAIIDYSSLKPSPLHAMAIVGYDDNVWDDLNGNHVVDSGEKGAFKVVNSYGAGGTFQSVNSNAGFYWFSYDGLRRDSIVSQTKYWPPTNRQPVFGPEAYVLTMTSVPFRVTSVTPNSMLPGADVVVSGSGFSASDIVRLSTDFTDAYVNITFNNSSSLKFSSANLNPAAYKLQVGKALAELVPFFTNSVPFTVESVPVIDSISPDFIPVGKTLYVWGSGFTDTDTVIIDDSMMISSQGFTGSIAIVIPQTLVPGQHSIKIKNSYGHTSDPKNFTSVVPPPIISSVSPLSLPQAGTLTIAGSGFTANDILSLTVDGKTLSVSAVSSDGKTIQYMTSGLQAGTYVLCVKASLLVGTSPCSNNLAFTLTAVSSPIITSLSPSSGPVGSVVTVSGSNFDSSATGVLGSTPITFFNITAGSMQFVVPDVSLGSTSFLSLGFQVALHYSSLSNVVLFTITASNQPSTITVTYPQEGNILANDPTVKDLIANVQWTSSNINSDYSIEIDLLNTLGYAVKQFANLPNTGTYALAADATIPNGTYRILVSTQAREGAPGSASGSTGFFTLGGFQSPTTLPAGCTSSSGFSSTTGEPCSSPTLSAPSIDSISPTSGSTGTLVTLKGYFGGVYDVVLDGPYCQSQYGGPCSLGDQYFTRVSDNEITFTLPSIFTLGVYRVSVRDTGSGALHTNQVNFDVISSPTITAPITVFSPNGGEVWQETPQVTDTLSGYEAYRKDISWTGVPDYTDPSIVKGYLEQKNSDGSFTSLGRIMSQGYGSIISITGLVSSNYCDYVYNASSPSDYCFDKANMKIVPPGQYYVLLEDTKTNTQDRSDAPFTIIASQIVPSITSITPTSGQIGTLVTINGSNFGDAKNFIGMNYLPSGCSSASGFSSTTGLPCFGTYASMSASSVDGKTLSFVIPATLFVQATQSYVPTSAGMYTVEVHNSGGGSNSVNFKVAPQISVKNPNGGETLRVNIPFGVQWSTNFIPKSITVTGFNAANNVALTSTTAIFGTPNLTTNSESVTIKVQGTFKMKVCGVPSNSTTSVCDTSDASFTVSP